MISVIAYRCKNKSIIHNNSVVIWELQFLYDMVYKLLPYIAGEAEIPMPNLR